jgi:hypothetical protein
MKPKIEETLTNIIRAQEIYRVALRKYRMIANIYNYIHEKRHDGIKLTG